MKNMKGNLDKYLEMTKPKVTLLNLLVGVTCFVLASFPSIDLLRLVLFLFVGYVTAGGCGVLNCVLDEKVDKLMERTSKRAIPSGVVTPKGALIFGMILTVGGLAISFFMFNFLTALMIFLGFIFYIPVYTVLLKRSSSWNVVIGGVAGCFAGLSGWTATGQALALTPLLLAAVGFLWTPAHLWGLAIKRNKDYKKAGIPMLPVVSGLERASQIVFLFNIATIGFSFLLPLFGLTGLLYLTIAVFAGVWLLIESRRLLIFHSESQGFKVFLISMPYLACLLTGLICDKVLFGALLSAL
jgi:protoheme IX farnesyltransferase